MEKITHAVNWIEIPVTNFDRAKKFYSTIFDYDMPEEKMGDQRLGFLLFNMEEYGIGGAIVQGQGYEPSNKGTTVYLNGGKDLNTVLLRVEDAGGVISQAKTHIDPHIGYIAFFIDSEGNKIGLHSRE